MSWIGEWAGGDLLSFQNSGKGRSWLPIRHKASWKGMEGGYVLSLRGPEALSRLTARTPPQECGDPEFGSFRSKTWPNAYTILHMFLIIHGDGPKILKLI